MKNGPYILIRAPLEYPGKLYRNKYIYEHVYVWWKNTNCLPPKGYNIHHRNGNLIDNRFENLELLLKSIHAKLHNGQKPKKMTEITCSWCKNIFSLETRNYKFRKKNGQKHFHCCRSCQVHTQQKLRLGR